MMPPTAYDEVLYPSYTHPQTHPDRLAVIGALFGMAPEPIDHCRVLELGCGNGANLAPMAWTLPGSEFVGIDLAGEPIREGQRMIREVGLPNLRLIQGDLREIDASWGQFDYLLAHGLFSWVPAEVRQQVLRLCRERLKPQGIAFISYNVYPGSHLRRMVREMMLFHVRGFETPGERVGQALALARFLHEGQDTKDEDRRWMRAELERVLEHEPNHVFHDELGEINEPFYFTQFLQMAAAQGLQFLGEADYFEMTDDMFKDSVRQSLRQLGQNRVLREQYLDFLKCRSFRQTLVCRREVRLSAEPQAEKIAGFHISSAATGGAVDLRPGVRCRFRTPKGTECETDFPAGKAALELLGARWPAPCAFDELVRQVQRRLKEAGVESEGAQSSPEHLADFLLRLYGRGMVECRTRMPRLAQQVSARPVVHPLARWQATRGEFVASLFHVGVKIEDEIGRNLLTWLDGSLDREGLRARLWAWLEARMASGSAVDELAAARQALDAKLEENLRKLANLGLLAG